jgi:hypothetical protein
MTENLNAGTFSLIRQFVEAGGQLVLFAKPTLVDGRPSPELADFLDRNASRIRRYTALDGKAIAESFADDRIRFCNVRGNDLYHQRRSYEDGELLFLVNSSLSDTATGSVGLPAGELVELDAVTGDMRPYPHTADGKSVGADFSLPPAGSLLLFAPASGRSALARTSRAASGTERPTAESVKLEPAGPLEVTRLKDNVLNLDFCDLTVDGRTERNLYTFEACNKLFNHCYGTGNPWDSAIQYRQTIVERDTLTTGDIRVSYHFVVAGDFDREKVLAFARSLPVPTAPAVDVPQPTWGADKRLPLSLPGRQQAHLLLAFHAVPLDHPDAPALMLLESVLSGQSGLLFNKLRDEQGLGYTVTAFYRSLPEAGFMAFYIGTTPRNLDVARQGFSGIIKDIKTDLLPAELLAKGLNRMEGSYYRGRQSLGARADEAASERLLGQPQDFQKRLLEKAAKVTPEQLREVARKYLLVDKMYEVTLLP